jgi:2-oxo-4-hydroxy-4-carboxy-5-ureidoimidazoline decarboxylase
MAMDRTTFLATFDGVFEHSAWVAEAVYDNGDMLSDGTSLDECFEQVFLGSDPVLQLATLRAHPQLACALVEPATLTSDSVSEQTGAGLDRCSESEFSEFRQLNTNYNDKFGFPFVIAVKGRTRQDILNNFRERMNNDPQAELQTALREVCRIARFRIEEILDV